MSSRTTSPLVKDIPYYEEHSFYETPDRMDNNNGIMPLNYEVPASTLMREQVYKY